MEAFFKNNLIFIYLFCPGSGQNVPVQAGKVLLDGGNKGGLCGMGTSIGACFKVTAGLTVHWIKIGLLGGHISLGTWVTAGSKYTQLSHYSKTRRFLFEPQLS